MADKAFPIYFNWNDMMRQYLTPEARCILMDALADFYENGIDPISSVPEELRFALALMIDCINIKRNRSAEMAERGRKGAEKRYAEDESKQSDSTAIAEPKQCDDHYNENNNYNGNDNIITPSNEGDARAKKRFAPPTIDEVRDYCNENGYRIDAEAFVDHYQSVGWKVGNKPMRDWKAAVRTWVRRDKERMPKKGETSFDTDDFFEAASRRAYAGVGA